MCTASQGIKLTRKEKVTWFVLMHEISCGITVTGPETKQGSELLEKQHVSILIQEKKVFW